MSRIAREDLPIPAGLQSEQSSRQCTVQGSIARTAPPFVREARTWHGAWLPRASPMTSKSRSCPLQSHAIDSKRSSVTVSALPSLLFCPALLYIPRPRRCRRSGHDGAQPVGVSLEAGQGCLSIDSAASLPPPPLNRQIPRHQQNKSTQPYANLYLSSWDSHPRCVHVLFQPGCGPGTPSKASGPSPGPDETARPHLPLPL